MILHRFSRYPVCEGGIDNAVGVVSATELLAQGLAGEDYDLRGALRQPLFVPESTPAFGLLERFRESGVHFALVVDEYGGTDGLITLNDLLEEIAGDFTASGEPRIVRRDDGSLLMDGSLTMEEFWVALGMPERRAEDRRDYNTVGGFVITRLGRIPTTSESFEAFGLRFEVVDMDGHRVDKLLVSAAPEPPSDRAEV